MIVKDFVFHKVKNKDFVGIKISNEKIHLFYPESLVFHINNEQLLKKEIFAFLKSFCLSNDARVIENDVLLTGFKDKYIYTFPLESYLFMLNHYLKNGPFVNREYKDVCGGKGKINWKKTLKTVPYFDNKNIYYLKTYNKQKEISNNIISEIYNYCVYDSIKKFGCWFYNMNENLLFVKYKFLSDYMRKLYIKTIDNEYENTFNEDIKLLLFHMKKILYSSNDKDDNLSIIGISEYHSVYEKLIDIVFGNVDVSNYYPTARWIKNGAEEKSSSLREDTIRIENKKALIIDSKCYAYDSKPDTSSIMKQIVYGEHLYENQINLVNKYPNRFFNKNEIFNFFIIPKPIYETNKKFIMYSDEYAISSWKKLDDSGLSFEKIYLFYIDLNCLLMNWAYNEKYDFVDEFIKIGNNKIFNYLNC